MGAQPRRILAVRTDRIGDAVLITPALSQLRRTYPDAHIAVLCSPYTADIFLNSSDVNEIITLKPAIELAKELRAGHFDAAVVFFVDRQAMLPLSLAGIPLRIGPGSKVWSVLLNKIVFQRRSKNPGHEADFNTALLEPLGIKPEQVPCRITVMPQEKEQAGLYLREKLGIPPTKKLLIMHPGSRGSAKNWPSNRYAELAKLALQKNPGLQILLTGSQEEKPLLEQISRADGRNLPLTAEQLSLRQLICLISHAGLMVTNSTGPLHLAVALGVPTLSFFPPIKGCLPQRWGPYGQGHAVLMPKLPVCAKCAGSGCAHFNCMDGIRAEEALAAAEKTAPDLFKP